MASPEVNPTSQRQPMPVSSGIGREVKAQYERYDPLVPMTTGLLGLTRVSGPTLEAIHNQTKQTT